MSRLSIRAACLAACVAALTLPALAAPAGSFPDFLARFEATAVAAGVSRDVYRAATRGLAPDPAVPNLVTTQPEFTTPIWQYIETRVTGRRIAAGRKAIAANQELFSAIGARYGVDPYLLAAIWGIETDYGAVLSNPRYIRPIIRSLATLVWEHRDRHEADAADFVAALKLVQRGPLTAATLLGSWAGAIGHLQVNPANVLAHGTDGDGDGRIDLHNSLADALATSAKFLLDLGYRPGIDWGYEVEVPAGFDYLLATRETLRPISVFAALGVTRVRGRAFSDASIPVFLYAPAGKDGPKFLMTANYLVLKGYNFSDSYALSVAHLTDRLKGAGGFAQDWPRQTRFPDLAQRRAIQEALIRLGYLDGAADGRIGPLTQAAYARFQASRGDVADGFITYASYAELAAATK